VWPGVSSIERPVSISKSLSMNSALPASTTGSTLSSKVWRMKSISRLAASQYRYSTSPNR